MSLIDELERLDRQRTRLALYEERARRLWFLPAMRKRFLARFAKRWHEASEKRSRVLGLIQADPAMRAELKAREQAALTTPSLPPRSGAGLEKQAAAIHALREQERRCRDVWQDAVWYYKSGEWKRHGLEVGEVTGVLDRFRSQMVEAARQRAQKQSTFEAEVARHYRAQAPANADHILERERLLQEAERATALNRTSELDARPQPNEFEIWLKGRVPELGRPERERTRRHDRER